MTEHNNHYYNHPAVQTNYKRSVCWIYSIELDLHCSAFNQIRNSDPMVCHVRKYTTDNATYRRRAINQGVFIHIWMYYMAMRDGNNMVHNSRQHMRLRACSSLYEDLRSGRSAK